MPSAQNSNKCTSFHFIFEPVKAFSFSEDIVEYKLMGSRALKPNIKSQILTY